MCREAGGQRWTCSLPVPWLPPCSRDRPAGALVPINRETRLRPVEGLEREGFFLCCQTSHRSPLWDMNPTPNSPNRSQSPQSSPLPAPAGGRGPPVGLHGPSHPQSWQQETCVSFPAVSWTSLTPCLQNLMITLPEFPSRQWISPWELLGRSWLSFHRKTERSCTCSLWLHRLVHDFFKSCTHFQGRLHRTSQSKHPKSQLIFFLVFACDCLAYTGRWWRRSSKALCLPANIKAFTHSVRPCIADFISAVNPNTFLFSISSPGK